MRRLLNTLGESPDLAHCDPACTYYLEGDRWVRPSSVEGWIEVCSRGFPSGPVRDFWEEVWNLSVCTWNYIATTGTEPWRVPRPGFPLSTPDFWQGFWRNRRIFDSLESIFHRSGLGNTPRFQKWIRDQVEFQFGRPSTTVPLGMAALGLTAPAEGYWVTALVGIMESDKREGRAAFGGQNRTLPLPAFPGVSIDCEFSEETQESVQVLHSSSHHGALEGGMAVLIRSGRRGGRVYFRMTAGADMDSSCCVLSDLFVEHFGKGWGHLEVSSARKMGPLELEWPWTGLARGLHALVPGRPSDGEELTADESG